MAYRRCHGVSPHVPPAAPSSAGRPISRAGDGSAGTGRRAGGGRGEAVRRAGLDPRYYFVLDESGDIPYRPYDPRSPGGKNHILIETPGAADGSRYRDISEVSQVVAGLARAGFTTRRAMFPEAGAHGEDLRGEMSRIFFEDHVPESFLPEFA